MVCVNFLQITVVNVYLQESEELMEQLHTIHTVSAPQLGMHTASQTSMSGVRHHCHIATIDLFTDVNVSEYNCVILHSMMLSKLCMNLQKYNTLSNDRQRVARTLHRRAYCVVFLKELRPQLYWWEMWRSSPNPSWLLSGRQLQQ